MKLKDLIAPFYGVTDIGNVASDWAEDNLASRDQLLQVNRQLEDENPDVGRQPQLLDNLRR